MTSNKKTRFGTLFVAPACVLGLLLFMLGAQTSCSSAEPAPAVDTTKKTSSDFYEPPAVVEEEEEKPKKKSRKKKGSRSKGSTADNDNFRTTPPNRYSSSRSGGGGEEVLRQDAARKGDSPQDFAKAVQYRIVRMVYPDPCKILKTAVVSSSSEGEVWQIEVEITWSDKWVRSPYRLTGVLTVNKDGSNARFAVKTKNAEAEALEITYEQFKSTLDLGQI